MKKCPKDAFPAMSSHFAYTLNDMAETYLKVEFVEVNPSETTLTEESLNKLIESRANIVEHRDNYYSLSSIQGDIRKYVCVYSDEDGVQHTSEISVDTTNGKLERRELVSSSDPQLEKNIEKAIEKYGKSPVFVDNEEDLSKVDSQPNRLYIVKNEGKLFVYNEEEKNYSLLGKLLKDENI